jgi:hypothetical protein
MSVGTDGSMDSEVDRSPVSADQREVRTSNELVSHKQDFIADERNIRGGWWHWIDSKTAQVQNVVMHFESLAAYEASQCADRGDADDPVA